MKTSILAAILLCFSVMCNSASAAYVVTSHQYGTITGVNEIQIGAQKWNVSFKFGSEHINAYSESFAKSASDALFALIDGGSLKNTRFDNYPDYIGGGCGLANLCQIATRILPESNFNYAVVDNYGIEFSDADQSYLIEDSRTPDEYQRENRGGVTFASWTPSSIPNFKSLSYVPIPESSLLFVPALLGFVGLRRKKRV